MKRETKVRIICGVTIAALAVGYVVSSPKNNTIAINVSMRDLVGKVAAEYYGEDVEVNDRFINAYIKTINDSYEDNDHHMSRAYDADSVLVNNNELFELTEWIPALEEVESNMAKVNGLH